MMVEDKRIETTKNITLRPATPSQHSSEILLAGSADLSISALAHDLLRSGLFCLAPMIRIKDGEPEIVEFSVMPIESERK